MSDSRNALASKPRGFRNALAGALRDKASEITEGFIGPPGSAWGELMNALMAGGRSITPGGGSYDDELLNVRHAREQQYPGAYSVIPEVRAPALSRALSDAMVSTGVGMAAPIMFHGSPKTLIRNFKGDKAGLSYFAYDPAIARSYGKHVGRYDVPATRPLRLGNDPYDASVLVDTLREAGEDSLAARVEKASLPDEAGTRYGIFRFLRDPEIVRAIRKAGHDAVEFADDHSETRKPLVMAVPADASIRALGRAGGAP